MKAAAAEALAVLAFVGSEHPSDTLEVAQHLQSLWKGDDSPCCCSLRKNVSRHMACLQEGSHMLQGCRGKILQHVLCIVCVENSLPTLRLLSIDQTSEPHTQCPDELYHCNSLRLLMQIPVHCPSLMKLLLKFADRTQGQQGRK